MQDNIITLPVDVSNSGTTTDTPFRRMEELQNRSLYVADDHTLASRNQFALYRTLPKPSGNFMGTAKSAARFTRDIEVPGVDASTTNTAPLIIEISASVPVGTSAADTLLGRQTALALLDDDAVIAPLMDILEI